VRYLAFLVVLGGCIEYGDFDPASDDPLTPAQRAWLEQALPVFQAECSACHGTTQIDTIGFLAGDTPWEIRENLVASGVISVESPTASRLFTKGVHTGPAMSAADVAAILAWLDAEHAEAR
jgi:mono/diheme cytochrome c family protein